MPTPVDMDRAGAAEIERLPRVGPVLARRIVADRERFGPFGSIEGLERVRGVGPALARRLEHYVTFSLSPRPSEGGGRGLTGPARAHRRRAGPPRSP
jgi:competence protein ComEA